MGGPGTDDPGRVTWGKVWLRDLVATAFHVEPENVSGPRWTGMNGAQLYALTATMPRDTNRHDFELKLQKFLIEQFKLKLHREPKLFPAYDLVVAPGGAKLKASADQSDPTGPNAPYLLSDTRIDAVRFPVIRPGHGMVSSYSAHLGGRRQTFQQYTMSEYAKYLIGGVTPEGSPTHYVVDKTGLKSRYDFKLKFEPGGDPIKLGPAVQAALGVPYASEPDSGLPNIFKALEPQLGLKLVKAKDIPMDTIVIDSAEMIPVGN